LLGAQFCTTHAPTTTRNNIGDAMSTSRARQSLRTTWPCLKQFMHVTSRRSLAQGHFCTQGTQRFGEGTSGRDSDGDSDGDINGDKTRRTFDG
jgi:hypothetical protein